MQFYSKLLDIVHQITNIMNGIMIAFHSDIVAQLVYYFEHGRHSLRGFLNSTLSYFDAKELHGYMTNHEIGSDYVYNATTHPYCV